MRFIVLLSALLTLGCAGLLGFGDPVATTAVMPTSETSWEVGVPFRTSVTPLEMKPYKVWLLFDVEATGGYQLTGPIEVKTGGTTMASYTLNLTESGSPIEGGGGRTTLNQRRSQINGKVSESATIRLFEIPVDQMEQAIATTISGTITAPSNVTVHSVEIWVTE